MDIAREKRIEIRSSEEEKSEFELAASLVHMGLSEFMRFAAHHYVKKIKEDHENIVLSKEAGLKFLQALEHPPEPNEKLMDAMHRYKKNVSNDSI